MNEQNNSKFESAKKFVERINESIRKQRELMSDNNYIMWLEKFTLKYQSFSDEDWLYCPNEISKNDFKQIENLQLLYAGIREYAERHNIEANPCWCGNYYNIKYNNTGYEIGIMQGQGTIQFCKRVSLDEEVNEDKFIDMEYVINEQKKISREIVNNCKINNIEARDKVLFYRHGKTYYFFDYKKQETYELTTITMNKLKERLTLPFDVEFSCLSRAQLGRIVADLLQDTMDVEIIKIINYNSSVLKFKAKFRKKEHKVSVFELSESSALYTRVNNNNPFIYEEVNGKKVLMEVAKDDVKENQQKYYFLASDLTGEERTFFDITEKEIICDYIYRLDNELKTNKQGKSRVRRIRKRLGN